MQGQQLRWRQRLKWSGLGLLALVAVAISWLLLADLGVLKPHIERWASEATGREVVIDGELHIDLAAHSSIIVEDLRISNADWAERPDMVSIGRLEVRLELLSLFRGPIVIELIDLDQAFAALARPESGAANWMLLPPRSQDSEDQGANRSVRIQQIDIDNVTVIYSTPMRAAPMELQIYKANQRHRQDDFLEISLAGTLNDREVSLDGEVGGWADLLAGRDVRFDLGARVDSLVLNAEGEIDHLSQPIRPRITFDAAAPDVNHLLQALNVERTGQGDISLNGSLMPMEQGPLVLDVAGRVGRLDIDASGAFSDLRNLQEVDLDVLASGEDVRPILEALGIPQTRSAPFMVNVKAKRDASSFVVKQADMVFGDAKVELSARLPEFPRIDDGVIKLLIEGPDIERFRQMFDLPGAATGPFSVGLTVDVADDGFELLNVDIRSSLGQLIASGRLGTAPKFVGTNLDFQFSSSSLAAIAGAYGVPGLPDQAVEIRGGVEIGSNGIRTTVPLLATLEDVTAEIEGLIQPVKGLLGSDFAFVLTGPDLAQTVGAFAGNKGVPVQPYALEGQLQIRDDGYRLRGVSGKLGTSDVQIDGLLVPRRRIAGSRFTLEARGAAFNEIIDQFGDLGVRPGPYELSGQVGFQANGIDFRDVELTRATADIDLDLQLGLPVSQRSAKFDLRASGPNVQLMLARFKNFAADEAPFVVELEGSVAGSELQIQQLQVQVGLAKLQAAGGLDFAGESRKTAVSVTANIPDMAALGTLNDKRLRSQPVTLDAKISSSGGEVRSEDLRMSIGDSDINGELRYVAGEPPLLEATIKSEAIVFAPSPEEPVEPVAQRSIVQADGRLIPDIEVPFEAMAGLDANINVEIGQLYLEYLKFHELTARARMAGGRLDLTELQFRGLAGALSAKGYLDPRGAAGAAGLEVVARRFALGLSQQNRDLAMTGDLDVKLESTGTDLRALAGNASGVIFVNAGGGQVAQNRALRALYGDALQEIFDVINPFRKKETQTLFECMILPLEIESGIVTSNPNSLIATSRLQIAMKSRINLKNEKIEINMKSTPKKGITISAGELVNPYIEIVGTLAEPRLAVDEKGVLLSGGAAFATGGLSILASAAWSRLSRNKDPCKALATEGLKNLEGRLPNLTVLPPLQPAAAGTDTPAPPQP